ncbi:hypothetical protein OAC95_00880 [Polaribacter sp.]|nr:hypothetical protein [Polaribacter sp.]|tara:strand:- start:1233 stop:1952 length:720 start_codon:yes stop_codon:yes gene_type:complete
MEDKWRINKIGDDFNFIPKKERDEKLEYERLLSNIGKREKKIESDLVKIGKLKEGLRKMKGDRTKGFNKMIKYYKKFLPTFSTFLGGEDDGNPQWGMWVSIGGKRKYIYIGTVNDVSYHLDLLENNVPHYNKNNRYEDGPIGYYNSLKPKNYEGDEHKEIITSKIESYLGDVVKKKMLGVLKKDGNLDRFYDKKYKLKGIDILYDLYKKSPHYTPPQKEREKKKGGRLKPINVGKKKQW